MLGGAVAVRRPGGTLGAARRVDSFTSPALGAGEYSCNGVSVSRVNCEEALASGISTYCRGAARAQVPGRGLMSIYRRSLCQRFCEAAAVDCLTQEVETAGPVNSDFPV